MGRSVSFQCVCRHTRVDEVESPPDLPPLAVSASCPRPASTSLVPLPVAVRLLERHRGTASRTCLWVWLLSLGRTSVRHILYRAAPSAFTRPPPKDAGSCLAAGSPQAAVVEVCMQGFVRMRLYISWADASEYNCWVRRGREPDFLRSCKLSTRQPRYWAGLTPLMALEKSHRRSKCSHCRARTPSVGRGQRPRDRGTCARALNPRLLGRNSRILIGCSS